jgi:hypothetical protein
MIRSAIRMLAADRNLAEFASLCASERVRNTQATSNQMSSGPVEPAFT